jgi:lipid-A-disaccharide synthase-like uncharacterized protein
MYAGRGLKLNSPRKTEEALNCLSQHALLSVRFFIQFFSEPRAIGAAILQS